MAFESPLHLKLLSTSTLYPAILVLWPVFPFRLRFLVESFARLCIVVIDILLLPVLRLLVSFLCLLHVTLHVLSPCLLLWNLTTIGRVFFGCSSTESMHSVEFHVYCINLKGFFE